ncbi:MAG TPA: hypothetical protein VLM38_08055 [Blastocatellia bacterium]|nr:hypothetical protein [Blastocatellia bacterium]
MNNEHSGKIIKELAARLPKGSIQFGAGLPASIKCAVKELVRLTPEKQTVEELSYQLIVVLDMNRYLDYKGVRDRRQRDLIKRLKTAFTLDQQWPIYINGESDLYSAITARQSSVEDPVVYKLAGVIAHERVHAQGESSEVKAIEEEIRILEIFVVQSLVELEWLTTRKAKLAQLVKGQLPDEPLRVNKSKPSRL